MPMNIKIEEATKHYAITKGEGYLYDREMDIKSWIHPAKHITVIEGQDDSTHYTQAYTDVSKNEAGIGSGVAVFAGGNLKTTLRYRLNERCTNNQAEQMAILKALEYIQQLNDEKETALVYTDSRITLQLLKNHKRHTHIIDQIKNKAMDMERDEWKVEFSWIKAHAGQRGNLLAD
jgi:ribonuclease HI